MLKKTITYTDYNNEERTEDFYFNLSKAELLEMELSVQGGLSETIKRIVDAKDVPALIKLFKELVLKAYGVKSLDGKRIIKTEELSTEFSQTEAYSQLFVSLAMDADEASVFVNGIVPADVNTSNAPTLST
jgi:hypothetical protein